MQLFLGSIRLNDRPLSLFLRVYVNMGPLISVVTSILISEVMMQLDFRIQKELIQVMLMHSWSPKTSRAGFL